MVWDRQCLEHSVQKGDLISESMNYEGICRTAKATPGLLITRSPRADLEKTNSMNSAEFNYFFIFRHFFGPFFPQFGILERANKK